MLQEDDKCFGCAHTRKAGPIAGARKERYIIWACMSSNFRRVLPAGGRFPSLARGRARPALRRRMVDWRKDRKPRATVASAAAAGRCFPVNRRFPGRAPSAAGGRLSGKPYSTSSSALKMRSRISSTLPMPSTRMYFGAAASPDSSHLR